MVKGAAKKTRGYHESGGNATHCVVAVCSDLLFCDASATLENAPRLTLEHSVDDVEDSSILRRGIPVAHSIFGTPQTINSANYIYFKALQDLLVMQNPKLVEIFTEELLNLHRGQGMDLYWRDSLTCPSEADYLEMVGNKTGGLFRLAIKLMQAESAVEVYVPKSHSIPSQTPILTPLQ